MIDQQVKLSLNQIEQSIKFDFFCNSDKATDKAWTNCLQENEWTSINTNFLASPMEKRDQKQTKALNQMKIYANLDEFYDVLIQVESSFIKAHSIVLAARSDYFKGLFESGFYEQRDGN